jgi:predicted DNA-binding protein
MTTHMIRKQIYLPKQLDDSLKRLSKKRGVSEAEVIRQALEHESSAGNRDSRAAVESILRFSDERLALKDVAKPYTWNRDEIYQERENRWGRNPEK